jgi:hypothetical protein
MKIEILNRQTKAGANLAITIEGGDIVARVDGETVARQMICGSRNIITEVKYLPNAAAYRALGATHAFRCVALYPGEAEVIEKVIADYRDAVKAKEKEKQDAIFINIPGLQALKDAYSRREILAKKEYNWIEEANREGIAPDWDNPGAELEAVKKEVERLEDAHPKAKAYIKWSGYGSETKMGFAAHLAAEALAEGKSLEDAQAIAEDYDHFD